ncbi:hypothetical protein D3C81_1129840 [compost metagenome]
MSLSQPRLRQGLSTRRGRPLSPPSCMPGVFQSRLLVCCGVVPLPLEQAVRARERVSRARDLAWGTMSRSVSPCRFWRSARRSRGWRGSARRSFLMIWGTDHTPLGRARGGSASHCDDCSGVFAGKHAHKVAVVLFRSERSCKVFLNLKPNASCSIGLGIILRALPKLHCWRGSAPGIPFLGRQFLVTGCENPFECFGCFLW